MTLGRTVVVKVLPPELAAAAGDDHSAADGRDVHHHVTSLGVALARPCYLSPGWLRIDPTFASLEGNPRVEKLID